MAVIGLDLGGTKLAGAIFNKKGEIINKKITPLEKRKGKEVGNLIKEMIINFLGESKKEKNKIEAIGICVPGISYHKTGKVWVPNIPGWENYPLLKEINSVIGKSGIKVNIDSDRSCYILGEVWRGAAKGCKDAIFLAVGTGIGAGILINGKTLHGSNDIAGAIGWLALDRPYLKKYDPCGCFEYYTSGEGLARSAVEFLKEDKKYKGYLRNKNIKEINSRDVFDAYEKNDPLAKKVIGQAIEFWGMTTANLVSIFNPEKIIFGGGVFGPAKKFIPDILKEAEKWSQPISIKQIKLEPSALGSDAGLYGAGFTALEGHKQN